MRFSLTTLVVTASLLATSALAAQAAKPGKFDVLNVSDYVDMVTVLPGERFPLRAVTDAGKPLPVKWSASGGQLVHASNAMALWKAPLAPGVHRVSGVATVKGKKLTRTLQLVVTVPATNVRNGALNGYRIGTYPRGYQTASAMIANRGVRRDDQVPAGFIELTAKNLDTPISEHYKLRDFAGKDAWVKGKKYLFIEPRLVEKLERATDLLQAGGFKCGKLELMSAYRSPWLNAAIGNTTKLSRHTYGDAGDVHAQDFNRDGRVSMADAKILMDILQQLDETTHLTGGLSLYNPNSAHGYFIHTDTRGVMARW